ncbi:hypothetical protein MTO96_009543 [Rhipicephalus appendiculatus]
MKAMPFEGRRFNRSQPASAFRTKARERCKQAASLCSGGLGTFSGCNKEAKGRRHLPILLPSHRCVHINRVFVATAKVELDASPHQTCAGDYGIRNVCCATTTFGRVRIE